MKLNLKLLGVGSSYCKHLLAAFCFLLLAGGVGAQNYSISTGDDYGAVIDDTGNLYLWGALQENGGGLSQVLPSGVWQSVSVSKTAAADAHILAIRTDGTLWAWGRNDRGQLGVGDQDDRVDPVQISSATNWVEVAAGAQHSLARNNGGKVFAWGDNTFGQLNVTPIFNDPAPDLQKSIPVQSIDPSNDYMSIAAGNHHSHAIRADGTLWAWGSGGFEGNGGPELGLPGGSLPFPVGPVALTQVGSRTGWTRLFGGYQVTYALRDSSTQTGQLWAWGAGGFIGTGSIANILQVPTRVGSGTDWAFVSRATSLGDGKQHTLALKTDGSLYGWGSNSPDGQLGLPLEDGNGNPLDTPQTNAYRLSPTRLQSPDTFLAVGAGDGFSAVIRSDGFLLSAGRNDQGQLANGSVDTTPETGQDFFGLFDFSTLNVVDLSLQNLIIDENPAFPGIDPTLNLTADGELFLLLDLANLGTVDLNQDFDLGVSLSPASSPSFDGSGAIPLNFIGSNRVTSDIEADDSVGTGFRVQLPVNITPDEYVLIVRGDAQTPRELNENASDLDNNDIVSLPLSFLPDLSATVEVTTPTITRGGTVDSVLTIENVGNWSSTQTFQVTAVLSPTPRFNSLGAIPLTVVSGGTVTDVIDPNGSETVFISVDIPATVPDGCYYLIYRLDDAGVLGEIEIDNNDATIGTQVCFGSGFEDLQVNNLQILSDPLNPSSDPANNLISGGQLVVSIDLNNLGDTDISDDFELAAVLSPSGLFDDPNAIALTFNDGQTVAAASTAIPAGDSSTVGARLRLPAAITPGVYDLVVRGDSTDVIAEITDANNDAVFEGLSFIPDVSLAFEILSSTLSSPGSVSGIITLENVGSYSTQSAYMIPAVLSTTPFYNGLSPNPIGNQFVNQILDPGEVLELPFTYTLPATLDGDCFYLAMRAGVFGLTEEQNLSNNDFVSDSICFGLEAADLVVSNVTAQELPEFPGVDPFTNMIAVGEFIVSIGLENIGDAGITDDFELQAFLSPSAFINDPEAVALTFLDGATVEADIAAGAGTTVGARLALPATIPNGTYNLIIVGDSGEVLTEVTRVNNSSSLEGLEFIPDLALSFEMLDEGFSLGESVDVRFTVENVGTWTATADFDLAAVLGTTPFYDGLDSSVLSVTAGNSTVTADLNPGESIQVDLSLEIPLGFDDGSYYLIARADDARALDEVVILNNDVVANETFDVGVDLTVPAITLGDSTPTLGADLAATVFVENLGSRDFADDVVLRAVLSLTPDFNDPEAIPLPFDGAAAEFTVSTVIPTRGSISVPVIFEFPAALDQGSYYLIICADPDDAVVEFDENNNCVIAEQVFEFLPDLVFDETNGIVLSPVEPDYDPGETLEISINLENTGTGFIPSGTSFDLRVFLSPTQSANDSGAIDLESEFEFTLASDFFPGAPPLAIDFNRVLPVGLATGSYYIGGVVDLNNDITEQTELLSNNDVVLRENGELNNVFFTSAALVNVLGIAIDEAIDEPGRVFTTSGDSNWFGQDQFFNVDGDAVQSPALAAGQSASFSTVFADPVIITFDWRADTSSPQNSLTYRVIGGNTGSGNNTISGDTGWQSVSRVVTAGAEARWTFNQGVDAPGDAVYVDNLQTFVVTAPELIVDSVSLTENGNAIESGTYVLQRDNLELNINSRNQGTSTGPLDDFTISVYLSTDRELNRPDGNPNTGSDTLIRQITVDDVFTGGNFAVNAASISLPTDILPGSYYLLVYIDDYTDADGNLLPGALLGTGRIDEFTGGSFPGETNNLYASQDPIVEIVTLPDLVVTDLNPEPGYYQVLEADPITGELVPNTLNFDFTIANLGLAGVDDPFRVKILLSRDEIMDPDSDYVVLDYIYANGLAALGSSASSQEINPGAIDIRQDLVDLGYIGERLYFGAFIDTEGVIEELNENNNAKNTSDNDFIFSELPVFEAFEFDEGAGNLVTHDTTPPFNGDLPWVGQTSVTIDGVDAAMSTRIGNNGVSAFETIIDAGASPTFVTFRWKVSSQNDENGRDALNFYIDDFSTPVASIAGTEDGWVRVSRLVSPGEHTLRWEYAKDALNSAGDDRGWVDDFSFQVPNLIVESVSIDDSIGYTAGDEITDWSVTIRNIGLANVPPTPSFDIQLRVSADNTWNNGGEYTLITITDNQGLATGESRTYTQSTDGNLAIPTDISLGALYFVGAYVDWNEDEPITGSIPESDDTDNSLFTFSAALDIAPSITLPDAIDDTFPLDLTVGGAGSWFGVADSQIPGGASDGVDAAQSGITGPGQSSYLEATVQGPLVLDFNWKVSSRLGSNFLEFMINGVVQNSISGEIDWTSQQYFIPAGTQELRWTYRKTGEAGAFADVGWLDAVSLSPFSGPELALTDVNYTAGEYVLDVEALIGGGGDNFVGTRYLDITVEAANQGDTLPEFPGTEPLSPTDPSNFSAADIEVRLSLDRQYGNADDIILGSFAQAEGGLDSGQLLRFIGPLPLGDSIPEGFYYLMAKIDTFALVADDEFTTDNNLWIGEQRDVQITRLPQLDLVTSVAVIGNSTGKAGDLFDLDETKVRYPSEPYKFNLTIRNVGLGRVAGSEVFENSVELVGFLEEDLIELFAAEEPPTLADFQGLGAPYSLGDFGIQELLRGRSFDEDSDTSNPGDSVSALIEGFFPSTLRLLQAGVIEEDRGLSEYFFYLRFNVDLGGDIRESDEVNRWDGFDPGALVFNQVTIDDNGTPGDTSDDTVENVFTDSGDNGLFQFNQLSIINAGAWAALYGVPAPLIGDSDTDGTSDFLEYAFNRNPTLNDSNVPIYGSYGEVTFQGEEYLGIVFDFVALASDLRYIVEASSDVSFPPGFVDRLAEIQGPYGVDPDLGPLSLTGAGGLIDGGILTLGDPTNADDYVLDVVDYGYGARISVRDSVPISAAPSRFIRIRVE